jgi:hypothetical protein
MTQQQRKQSVDEPGFYGYIGGGRLVKGGPMPLGSPMRAMFEFMPADEDCPPQCPKCKLPRLRKGAS